MSPCKLLLIRRKKVRRRVKLRLKRPFAYVLPVICVFEADLLLNGSTIFNDSSYTLDDVSLTFSSQELEVSSAEVSNVDLDGIQGSEVIRSIFTVEGIPASENSTKAQLTYAFNSKFLHLGNGFDEDNKPSFSIRVRVIN